MTQLSIRVDDFPGTKPAEFGRHNLTTFRQFDQVMTDRGLSYTLGVIPRYVGQVELSYLGCSQHIEIAMHGVDHREDPGLENEFEGDAFSPIGGEHDVSMITMRLSREIARFTEMSGKRPRTYIPPHNVIDGHTIEVLGGFGFKKIMGGPGSEKHFLTPLVLQEICSKNGMTYVQSMPPFHYGRSDELLQRGSIPHILKDLETKSVCLTLHWTWESNIGLGHLRRYLDKLLEGMPK